MKMTLVVLAAGMGSRYGGLKQMDPVDEQGHKIIDFSVFDAWNAGFEKVVFIIKHSIEKDFKEMVGNPISKHMEVEYVYQELDEVPDGFEIPAERKKPWGTAHALWCCKDVVEGPFMVINADDFYGKSGYRALFEFLNATVDVENAYAMVSYEMENTLTENGKVTRGVCVKDKYGNLKKIDEIKELVRLGENLIGSVENGIVYDTKKDKVPVSMNMWGFKKDIFDKLEIAINEFFEENVKNNPLGAECLIPNVIDRLIKDKAICVKVIESKDKWFGVTYKEDKPFVVKNIDILKKQGEYPNYLWN